jgi:hypothetical protein
MEKEAIKLVEALHRRQDRSTVTALSADDIDGVGDADEGASDHEGGDDSNPKSKGKSKKKK